MTWFNWYGFVIMCVIMAPNILYMLKHREAEQNNCSKALETLEQIGRYGSFIFMALNIPYLCAGFCFDKALAIYLAVNGALLLAYCIIWIICFNSVSMFRALSLSILPSLMFMFSGILLLNIPLIAAAAIFAPAHIAISAKNTAAHK